MNEGIAAAMKVFQATSLVPTGREGGGGGGAPRARDRPSPAPARPIGAVV